MPHIRTVPENEAEGELARLYDEARRRAGKVFNIVKAMSLAPRQLRASMLIYTEVVYGESALTRAQREMIAVVVSKANTCHYCMCAHADDLRSEGIEEGLVQALCVDWRGASSLKEQERAMLVYAEKLTLTPSAMEEKDVLALREAGWSDRAISDIVQVAAYFNYINRVALGLGVEAEDGMPPRAEA